MSFNSLAVVNGNSSEELDSELVAQHCWLDVMLKFRSVAQRPLGIVIHLMMLSTH